MAEQLDGSLPNAPSYRYIGENPHANALVRGGTSVDLATVTDRKLERIIKKDERWLTQFERSPTSNKKTTMPDKASK